MDRIYCLPNGNTTHNVNTYIDAWNDLCTPLENAMGISHFACDPDVTFMSKNKQSSISLPVWFLQELNMILKERG